MKGHCQDGPVLQMLERLAAAKQAAVESEQLFNSIHRSCFPPVLLRQGGDVAPLPGGATSFPGISLPQNSELESIGG